MTDGDSSHWLARYVRTNLRFLTFRNAPIAPEDRKRFIKAALVCTWIAGIGRYWDHTDAYWWQHAGIGSVAYVFVLAAVLRIVGLPLSPRAWNEWNVLLFVAMTSPLAWLYAIPVERFMPIESAASTNAWFLLIVALWRVGLLIRFFAKPSGLGWVLATCATMLPLAGIVTVLAILNLEHATYDIMSSGGSKTPAHDGAYATVVGLTFISWITLPIWGIAYGIAVTRRDKVLRQRRQADAPTEESPS